MNHNQRALLMFGMMALVVVVLLPPMWIVTKKETFSKVLVGGAGKSEVVDTRWGGWRFIGEYDKPVKLSEQDDPVDPSKGVNQTKTVMQDVPEIALGLFFLEVAVLLMGVMLGLRVLRRPQGDGKKP